MEPSSRIKRTELTALLITPDRSLAEQLAAAQSRCRTFQILGDLKTYPPRQTLETRLKQLRPDLVLLDVTTDLETAREVVRLVTMIAPSVQVVALSAVNDSDVLLTCLRMGASEFLYSPFDPNSLQDAASRLLRLREPEQVATAEPGKVIAFSSTKPGSGSSTLAIQTASSLRRYTKKRVLLADFDLLGGTIGFYSKLQPARTVLDALAAAETLEEPLWSSLVVERDGLDVLAGPDLPHTGPVDPRRLNAVVEYARMNYDWVVIDLPVIFHRMSLMALSISDFALLVSTTELPSLHLTRKAVQLLQQLGFPKDRFQILLNRVKPKDDISRGELEKLLSCPVISKFPNDHIALHRVIASGASLEQGSDLGKAIQNLAAGLLGSIPQPSAAGRAGRPVNHMEITHVS